MGYVKTVIMHWTAGRDSSQCKQIRHLHPYYVLLLLKITIIQWIKIFIVYRMLDFGDVIILKAFDIH